MLETIRRDTDLVNGVSQFQTNQPTNDNSIFSSMPWPFKQTNGATSDLKEREIKLIPISKDEIKKTVNAATWDVTKLKKIAIGVWATVEIILLGIMAGGLISSIFVGPIGLVVAGFTSLPAMLLLLPAELYKVNELPKDSKEYKLNTCSYKLDDFVNYVNKSESNQKLFKEGKHKFEKLVDGFNRLVDAQNLELKLQQQQQLLAQQQAQLAKQQKDNQKKIENLQAQQV